MAIQKREYELSVWNEELVNGIKKESKGIIIGAHDMSYLGRATSIKFTRHVKGTTSLTFQMPTKFFDSELGQFVQNEFINELYNERKLKLHYKGKWYEYYIKQIQEDKQFKAIMKTFTCQDAYIDELSRTGYEIEFAPELNNSVEEIGVFSEEILEKSIWDYRPEYNWGDFTEYREERFYRIPLSQFGGSIKGYRINLKVEEGEIQEEDKIPQIKNFNTHEKRNLEYGDDLARAYKVFWDKYDTDNGRAKLLDDAVTLTGDYIYVPISQLKFIMGSIFESSTESLETPAFYGDYRDKSIKYALQPYSQNPKDLIQFIFFGPEDYVVTDEVQTIVNNDCHYIIPIEEWNKALENKFSINKGCIYWKSLDKEGLNKKEIYTTIKVGEYWYTTNVQPKTSIIDKFTWYPVYYEGYLDSINEEEVGFARKIVISDRTELNVHHDIYTKVYKNNAIAYKNLYSESEINKEVIRRAAAHEDNLRVISKLDTMQILPSLARNLIQNGKNITDTNGWEAKTQNNNDEQIMGTASFKRLLEISVKTFNQNTGDTEETIQLKEDEINGKYDDERITNYYLELLSPIIDKTDNFNLEGEVFNDYALNFGVVGQEKNIEKGKIYAIRIETGLFEDTENGGQVFNTYHNRQEDLNRIIIGRGATDSKGNYIVDGINNDDGDFINIGELYSAATSYVPDGLVNTPATILYHVKNGNTWSWVDSIPTSGDYVEDKCFILFKAPKTIKNPYVAIKVESNPLEIKLNNSVVTEYSLNDAHGVKINIIANSNDVPINNIATAAIGSYKFYGEVPMEIVEVNSYNFSEDFLNRLGYDFETGLINPGAATNVTFNEGDKLDKARVGMLNSSIVYPVYCTTIGGQNGDKKSMANALFVDSEFAGVFWLEKESG